MQSSFTPPPPLEERKPSATVSASPYSVPPGLVGEIALFTYAQAPRPVAEIALAAGIGLVSGIVGRAFNVFGNGTNVYILLLAPTGTGKEAPSTAIAKLMQAASAHTLAGQIGQTKLAEGGLPLAKGFIGASDFSSAPALHRKLAKQISFLSIINEFGELLGLLFDKPNMNMRTLRKMIVQLYEKSKRGNTLGAAAYADIEKDIAELLSPALSILAESVPGSVYGSVDDSAVTSGFLTRFSFIEYNGKRPPLNENCGNVEPSAGLVQKIADLCAIAASLNSKNAVTEVTADVEAMAVLRAFNHECDNLINSETDEVRLAIYTRSYVKVLKLAAIIAVGCNPYAPTITREIADWSIEIERHTANTLIQKFSQGLIGDVSQSEVARQNKIRSVVSDWFSKPWSSLQSYVAIPEEMRRSGFIPHTYLSKRLTSDAAFKNARNGSTAAIKNSIAEMIRNGELMRATGAETAQFTKSHAEFYKLAGGASFLNPQMHDP